MIGIQPAMVNLRLSSGRRFHSKLTQECHHRAPISKRRLEEVQAYEGGEQIPVGRDPVAECSSEIRTKTPAIRRTERSMFIRVPPKRQAPSLMSVAPAICVFQPCNTGPGRPCATTPSKPLLRP